MSKFRVLDFRPVTNSRAIGLRLMAHGTCPSEIGFGNRYDAVEEGIHCEHVSVMTVGCNLPVGHDGPHCASREDYVHAESPRHLADRKFTLMWENEG